MHFIMFCCHFYFVLVVSRADMMACEILFLNVGLFMLCLYICLSIFAIMTLPDDLH